MIITIDENYKKKGACIKNYISWNRLQRMFREIGELKPEERIVQVEIDEKGIVFSIEKR